MKVTYLQFWLGLSVNLGKALVICSAILVIDATYRNQAGHPAPVINGLLTLLGVLGTGLVTTYYWRPLGWSRRKMLVRALLHDWLGTFAFIFVQTMLESQADFDWEKLFAFFFLSHIYFIWLFILLILFGQWLALRIWRQRFVLAHKANAELTN